MGARARRGPRFAIAAGPCCPGGRAPAEPASRSERVLHAAEDTARHDGLGGD